ncbi:MAG: LysR family transcriptional regulator [Gammaproteobacteria bacterium SG8_47]|nr:MAG: LysR family transcriptional regulator [Gammaproteobacteria bacterium SG8_47]
MSQLNLKHLRYFWVVAASGSIARASEQLHLTPQTISGQLRELEEQIGAKLFKKVGRNLVLSDTGRLVFSYADEMFRIGNELQDVLAGRTPGSMLTFNVGIAMVVPKLLAYRVLAPVLAMDEPVRLVCHEAPLVDLLADLSVHKLDMVLADSPLNPALNIRAYNHVLGESGLTFFATRTQARRYAARFPRSLDGAPFLMPSVGSSLRRALELWLEAQSVRPAIVAEFEDRALMKAFGEGAAGIFTSPTAVEDDVLTKYGVKVIGRAEEVTESYYAISAERRIKHPAVSAITAAARKELFR